MNSVIIDVREKDEFTAEHIENSIHVPLSCFGDQAPAILRSLDGKSVTLICRSGKRSQLALEQARAFAPSDMQIESYSGGILAWKQQGNRVVSLKKAHFPILRQVQLVAGSLIIVSIALSFWVSHSFAWIAGFVGVGLTVAGTTGFCGMAELLARMPWNRGNPKP